MCARVRRACACSIIIVTIIISPPSFDIFDNKILTEASKAPLRAVALASFLGDGFAALGSRAPPVKDLMAFGAVLHTNQHNIGESNSLGPAWVKLRKISAKSWVDLTKRSVSKFSANSLFPFAKLGQHGLSYVLRLSWQGFYQREICIIYIIFYYFVILLYHMSVCA